MSSTNKTPNLRLNKWIGSDIPSRADFVNDNILIDSAVNNHVQNGSIHLASGERDKWNSPSYVGTYMGNGAVSRSIDLGAPFNPSFGIIFPIDILPSVNDFTNRVSYNYLAFFSTSGSSAGVSLSSNRITVEQSTHSTGDGDYKCFNENGTAYVYVVFR